jgi:hypothetical protein
VPAITLPKLSRKKKATHASYLANENSQESENPEKAFGEIKLDTTGQVEGKSSGSGNYEKDMA